MLFRKKEKDRRGIIQGIGAKHSSEAPSLVTGEKGHPRVGTRHICIAIR